MKKNLLLYILLGFLVIMNAFFLFQHFSSSDQNGPKERVPGNFITEQLKFDDAQTAQFKKLDAEHRKKMKAIQDDIKVFKDRMFDKLSDKTVNRLEIEAIATSIANMEAAKEIEIFYFFKSIGDLCTENQRESLKAILKAALGPRRGRDGKGRPDGPGGEHRPPPPPRH